MIVTEKKPTLEISEEMKSTAFAIGDLGMVFDILRSKLYSNPILAICREISSNARDAHREVGEGEKPIQITLPNAIEPSLRIKDWGPGLSPERVETIFVNFGSSTKRNTNEQSGYFGLGCKVPFAYTDTFTVQTVVNKVLYTYSCVIDESKIGKMIEMSRTSTKEPNGTEVVIPIKTTDFKTFIEGIEFVTRHWDPKPTIKGGKFTYQTFEPVIEGHDWKLIKHSGYDAKVRLIIDAIEYPLDHSALKDYHSLDILPKSSYCQTLLYFKTGELSLSASREAVHLDEKTEVIISERLKKAYKELKKLVQAKIDKSTSLFEANKAYAEMQKTLSVVTNDMNLKWNDKPLHTKLSFYGLERWDTNYSYSSSANINFAGLLKMPMLYVNDLPPEKPSASYLSLTKEILKPLFDNIKEKHAFIITTDATALKKFTTQYGLDEFEMRKLSEYIVIKPKKEVIPRVTIFKLKDKKFNRVKYADYKADKNDKVICLLKKESYSVKRNAMLNGKYVAPDDISAMAADKKISIYGIDEKIKDDAKAATKHKKSIAEAGKPAEEKPVKKEDKIKTVFKGAQTLEEFVKAHYAATKIDYTKIKAVKAILNDLGYNMLFTMLGNHKDIVMMRMSDKGSNVVSTLKTVDDYRIFLADNKDKLTAYENMVKSISEAEVKEWRKNNAAVDLGKFEKQVLKQYPLLGHLGYGQPKTEDIVDYMNLMDLAKRKPAVLDDIVLNETATKTLDTETK